MMGVNNVTPIISLLSIEMATSTTKLYSHCASVPWRRVRKAMDYTLLEICTKHVTLVKETNVPLSDVVRRLHNDSKVETTAQQVPMLCQ